MEPKLLDVVALLEDVPAQKLVRGQVGTVTKIWRRMYSRSNSATAKAGLMPVPR